MTRRTRVCSELLAQIVSFFLRSPDFNGISLRAFLKDGDAKTSEQIKDLIARGDVEAYSEESVNPHIKRLPAAPIPRQLLYLSLANAQAVCLYPSTKHMLRVLPGKFYRHRPFSRFLALGHPQLEPIFFQLSVLARYQSDPRYIFRFNGLDGHISVKSDAYKSREMGESDKVMLETFGLGTGKSKSKSKSKSRTSVD